MKKLKLLTLVSIVSIFSSCNKEQNINTFAFFTNNLKVTYPYDVVPAKDGSYVYVLSYNKNYEKGFNHSSDSSYKNIVRLVYKISKDKKVTILDPENYNEFNYGDKEIEKTKDNELVILNNYYIYTYNKKLEKLNDLNLKNSYTEYDCTCKITNIGPHSFYSDNLNLYFSYYSSYPFHKLEFINKLEENTTKIQSIYNGKPFEEDDYIPDENTNKLNYTSEKPIEKNLNKYYPNSNSIYDDKPIFNITDLIKNEAERKKVGTIFRIRKNSKNELLGIDPIRNVVWKILPKEQKITLFAGTGEFGFSNGKGVFAKFNNMKEIDIDDNDNLYIADTGNNAIRKITPDGVVSTFYVEK